MIKIDTSVNHELSVYQLVFSTDNWEEFKFMRENMNRAFIDLMTRNEEKQNDSRTDERKAVQS